MTDEELNRRFDQLQESMRDMQTEILHGLERFARGNFARMHRLEVSDNDLNERLNALEERVTAIETVPTMTHTAQAVTEARVMSVKNGPHQTPSRNSATAKTASKSLIQIAL